MASQRSLRIIFTGGGSGGPTTPLIALYEELIQRLGKEFVHVLFLGTDTGPEGGMAERAGIPFEPIPYGKLRRYWSWKNFIDPLFILGGFCVGFLQLLRFRPQIVVSAGSFVSVPVAYAAWVLRIPHLILQMDVKPGLANKLMAPVSHALAYYFEASAGYFHITHKHQVGPVLRQEIRHADAKVANTQFNLKPDKPVLLITGGGQGALAINQSVEKILDFWLERFQVVHLTGTAHTGSRNTHPDYHPIPFVSQGMGSLLARSDLVVTRAGLGIIGEMAFLARDAVLIPIPGTHQELNARVLVEQQGAFLLPQEEFVHNGQTWWEQFLRNYNAGNVGKKLRSLLPPNGTETFAELILQYAKVSSRSV